MSRFRDPPAPPAEDADHQSDPQSVARTICLQQLTTRARTRAELADVLRRRGVPDDAAMAVLDRFTEIGLIDDHSFAQDFAVAAHRERGLSGRAVAMKLRQRGVDEGSVEAAVRQIDADSELEAARSLAERKLGTMRKLDPTTQSRRLFGLLSRRGYSSGLSSRVVGELVHLSPSVTSQDDDSDNDDSDDGAPNGE
jgi:regulatory protein